MGGGLCPEKETAPEVLASDVGERKCILIKETGLKVLQHSSPSCAAYKASLSQVCRINGPEHMDYISPEAQVFFHSGDCSENTHQRLPWVLRPSNILSYFADIKH